MRYILRRPRAFWISVCNLVGLACSMVGVVMLFWYALPEQPPGGYVALSASGPTPGYEAEVQRYHRLAYVGLVLVLIGTVMEAVPPLCTAIGSWRRRPIAPQVKKREGTEARPHPPSPVNSKPVQQGPSMEALPLVRLLMTIWCLLLPSFFPRHRSDG